MGRRLNLDGGTVNLDGDTLTLDGGTRPPYNLSTEYNDVEVYGSKCAGIKQAKLMNLNTLWPSCLN